MSSQDNINACNPFPLCLYRISLPQYTDITAVETFYKPITVSQIIAVLHPDEHS